MSGLLLISELPGELRVALWRDDRLTHLLIERDDMPGLAGRVLPGRVTRVDRGVGGAFIALSGGPEGLLPLEKAPAGLSEGDKAQFRITKPASAGKGPQLAPASDDTPDEAVEAWMKRLPAPEALACRTPAWRALWPQAGQADWRAAEQRLIGDLDALTARRVKLPGGGSILIEPVETLRAIDVDRGGDTRAALEINLEAAEAAARQIALRALSGLIVIDFLPLEPREDRRRLRELMAERLAGEEGRVEVELPSPGGIMALHRQRVRPALGEIMDSGPRWDVSPVATAFTALREASCAAAAPVLTLKASPAVIEALKDGPAAAARCLIEDQRGHDIALEPDPLRDDSRFEIS